MDGGGAARDAVWCDDSTAGSGGVAVAEDLVVGELEAEGVAQVENGGRVRGGGRLRYVGAHSMDCLLGALELSFMVVDGTFEALRAGHIERRLGVRRVEG